nr:hypothetical protein [Halomonas colorata]
MADNIKNSFVKVMIAIDIAKTSHDAVTLWPSGRNKTFKFPNTLVGYQNLINAAEVPAEGILMAFEPTGLTSISGSGFSRTRRFLGFIRRFSSSSR